MSMILSKNNWEKNSPSFHEFKKQASLFFKEKIKTARLALTDVTPIQLMTEEATSGNSWAPDTKTLGLISRAAFELDDYTRIVNILHKRLLKFEKKDWRVSYNSLIVLEHLLTHGPESSAQDFQSDKDVINHMQSFQHIDEKGFNWGLSVRKKSEKIMKLLNDSTFLKQERDKARKLTREIQGFGSFNHKSSFSAPGILRKTSTEIETYGRCNSDFNNHQNEDNTDQLPSYDQSVKTKSENSKQQESQSNILFESTSERSESSSSSSWGNFVNEMSFKENIVPNKEELHRWISIGESNPLMDCKIDEPRNEILTDDDHPFSDTKNQTSVSLLLAN